MKCECCKTETDELWCGFCRDCWENQCDKEWWKMLTGGVK